jgi:hypothetical protein
MRGGYGAPASGWWYVRPATGTTCDSMTYGDDVRGLA